MGNLSQRFEGKRVVVTGASGGIGVAICRRLCEEGADVLGADLTDAAQLPDDLAASPNFHSTLLDVTSEKSVKQLRDIIEEQWGRLDILINNAGIMIARPLLDTTVEDVDRLMAVNVRGPFLMMRALAPLLRTGGSVINMSSCVAARPAINMSAYAGSKAALVVMTKVAAMELAPIRVNAILPGAIDTPMPRKFVSDLPSDLQTKAFQSMSDSRIAKRMGQPEEVAALVAYVASDEAAFVTGSEIFIDGGRL